MNLVTSQNITQTITVGLGILGNVLSSSGWGTRALTRGPRFESHWGVLNLSLCGWVRGKKKSPKQLPISGILKGRLADLGPLPRNHSHVKSPNR